MVSEVASGVNWNQWGAVQQLEAGMQYRLESLMEFELKSKDKIFEQKWRKVKGVPDGRN